jgi:uncharacterized membrane protein (DUF106 family)
MSRTLSTALLIAGAVITLWVISVSDTIGSDLSRFFTTSPTQPSIWILIVGVVVGATGVLGLIRAATTS